MENLLEPWFKMNVGEGAFYALFGLIFVIAGIALLVLILMLIGYLMKKVNARREKGEEAPAAPSVSAPDVVSDDGIPPEVVAAIAAALMSYYEKENPKCDFVVRRIKRV